MEATQHPKPGKLSKMRSLLPLIPALEVRHVWPVHRLVPCRVVLLAAALRIKAALPPPLDVVKGRSLHTVMRTSLQAMLLVGRSMLPKTMLGQNLQGCGMLGAGARR